MKSFTVTAAAGLMVTVGAAAAPLSSVSAFVPVPFAATRHVTNPRKVIFTTNFGVVRRQQPPPVPRYDSSRLYAADYSAAARTLFSNMIGPASMLTGGIVPLGFLSEGVPGDNAWQRKLQCVFYFASVFALVNELSCVMWATIASNKLTEAGAAPASSVFMLIQRDYELHWVAANVHFTLGLLAFVGMVVLRAWAAFPATLNRGSAGVAMAALLGMLSTLNIGVAEGDGRGRNIGGNVVWLTYRYFQLLYKQVVEKKAILSALSSVMWIVFTVISLKNLIQRES